MREIAKVEVAPVVESDRDATRDRRKVARLDG
jgi:hypothetical protein